MSARIVLVTRRTRLEQLVERFNTAAQARFYVEHMGLDFADYAQEDETYRRALDEVQRGLEGLCDRQQRIERAMLPTFLFAPGDVVVAVGQDGLVVNAAKYLENQPIVAVNPDPARWDGVLLPFRPHEVRRTVQRALAGEFRCREVTMAEARLNDGQRLLAFNDLLVGPRTHVSARYRLKWGEREEEQASSGVLVSTGAGSTGWLSSAQAMARAVATLASGREERFESLAMPWEDPRLVFVVREPFPSRTTGTKLCAGVLGPGEVLELESRMPEGGVLFSDGVESDALSFNAGAIARIAASDRRARLLVA